MSRIIFTIFFASFFTVTNAQLIHADRIVGEWLSEEKDSRIEIYKSGTSYFGKLTWDRELFENDEETSRKDVQNRDVSLRDRNLQNVEILLGFVYDDGIWDNGKMYDPKSGKTYSCIIKLRNELLEIRSYIGFPLLGRSTYWNRVAKTSL